MMLLHVLGQGKRGYLTWKMAQVEEDGLSFDSWGIEYSIVKGWLIKTMEPDLIYELRCEATHNTQGGRDITSYFAELKTVWLKRDRRRPINIKCPDDKQRKAAHEKKKNGGSGVATVVAVGLVFVWPIAGATAGCSARGIIGCGTKKMRLYYMDDIAPGRVHQVRGVVREKHKKIWLWHQQLDHVSFANRGILSDIFLPEGKVKYAIVDHVTTHILSPQAKEFVSQMEGIKIPNRLEEAFQDPKWVEAMNVEMKALQKNGTWEIVPQPEGKKLVGCRWVYTVKHKAYGTIDRYKA
ncbi:unnamed protein product [Prunus armeniaca]